MDYSQSYESHEVICRQGEELADLLYLQKGRLLVCTVQGTQVKALSRIEPGEFVGELSFFDGKPRSTFVITLEPSVIVKVPRDDVMENLPFWYIEAGKSLTKKIRLLDEVINSSTFRRVSNEDQKPLTIEEQREILAAINK